VGALREAQLSLGRLRQPLEQSIKHASSVELPGVLTCPPGHRVLLLARHSDREVECMSDGCRTTDRNDHRGIADGLSDSAGIGGDHWPAAREHLLHQRDAERLDELWPRLARQDERGAACHQMWLLIVVDVVEEADPIRRGRRSRLLAQLARLGPIAGDHQSQFLARGAGGEAGDQVVDAFGTGQS
jgi:hypothetical protein